MREIRCIQGSPQWWALRRGIPTASEFGRIIKAAKVEVEVPFQDAVKFVENGRGKHDGVVLTEDEICQLKADILSAGRARKYARFAGYRASEAQDAYASELLAAALGWESDFKGTPDTERGNELEDKARKWLTYAHHMEVHDTGFFLADNGLYGASPDGMLEDGSPVEIKCPDLHTFLKWRMEGGLPLQHKAQVHGEMYVTGAARCIFVAYTQFPVKDRIMLEVRRDDFTEKLGACLNQFLKRLHALQQQHLDDEAFTKFVAQRIEAVNLKPEAPAPSNPTLAQMMSQTARDIRTGQ